MEATTRATKAGPRSAPGKLYIQQVAQLVGVSATTLRLWESQGLVRPQRAPSSGYRLYSRADVRRLQQIHALLQEGLNAAGVVRALGEPAAADDAESWAPVPDLGPRLKALRTARGQSLRELAAATGLSPSHISSLERSLSTPSIGALHALARALGTNLVKLLDEGKATRRERLIVPPTGRKRVDLGVPGVVIEELSAIETQLEALLFRVEPGAGSESSYSHPGDEFLYMLSGTFEVTLNEVETHTLRPGDSMTFLSHRPHRFRNPGHDEAVVLWINTPPTF